MTLEALIFTALMALPRTEMADAPMVARVINREAAGDVRIASLLIVKGFYESRFLDRIQAGLCKRHECDSFITPAGELRFRSRSFWQLQRGATASRAEWVATTGLDEQSVSTAAGAAGRRLRRGLAACGTYEGAIAYFAIGGCRWIGAARQAQMARRIDARIRAGNAS